MPPKTGHGTYPAAEVEFGCRACLNEVCPSGECNPGCLIVCGCGWENCFCCDDEQEAAEHALWILPGLEQVHALH